MCNINLECIIGRHDKSRIEGLDLVTIFDNRNELFSENQIKKLDTVLEIIAEYTAPLPSLTRCTDPDDIYRNIYRYFLKEDSSREHYFLICMNSKNVFKVVTKITSGANDMVMVPHNTVMKKALISGCSKIALAHNHPSGDPSPSREDIASTNRIIDSCKLLGITFIDHIIIGGSLEYVSLKREEYI